MPPRWLFAVAALLPTLACSRHSGPALTREAFLPFQNLAADASLDWVANAAPQILAEDLTGVPKIIPLLVPTMRDAYLNHADRVVHGYYELRSGKLHFEVAVEDLSTHRTVKTSAEDGPAGSALDHAAAALSSGAHHLNASESAVDAWAHGDFERATSLDPHFGLAWLTWTQQLSAKGDTAAAASVSAKAVTQSGLAPVDKERLALASATLRQDQRARFEASRDLAAQVPYDPAALAETAALAMTARDFPDAVKYDKLALQADPSDIQRLNALGYAQTLAGDLEGATKSFGDYARGPGEDPVNAIDSLGEAYFINGKFGDAQRQFEDAFHKEPQFLQGETLWKAAHAQWLAGDLPAADRTAQQFFELRAKQHDPLVTWRNASWLYETGRQQQARDLLSQSPPADPNAANLAKRQLAVWQGNLQIPSDVAALEQAYLHSDPLNDGLQRLFYAEALIKAGRANDSKELLARWPLPIREDSLLQSMLYPRFIALRKQLGVSR